LNLPEIWTLLKTLSPGEFERFVSYDDVTPWFCRNKTFDWTSENEWKNRLQDELDAIQNSNQMELPFPSQIKPNQRSRFMFSYVFYVNLFLKTRALAYFVFLIPLIHKDSLRSSEIGFYLIYLGLLYYTIAHDGLMNKTNLSFAYWRFYRGISVGNTLHFNKAFTEDVLLEILCSSLQLFIAWKLILYDGELVNLIICCNAHFLVLILLVLHSWLPLRAQSKKLLYLIIFLLICTSTAQGYFLLIGYLNDNPVFVVLVILNVLSSYIRQAYYSAIFHYAEKRSQWRKSHNRPNETDFYGWIELCIFEQSLLFNDVGKSRD